MRGIARQNLAHLDASGNLSSWNPGTDGPVHTLALSSGVLYVGGSFGTLGGSARSRLGALDASTGALTIWAPTANDTVRFLGVFSGLVYAGGDFTQINGTARNRVAALNTSGALTSWNPNADGSVRAIYRSGTNIALGGDFLNIGGTSQQRVALVNTTTGAAAPSVISANGSVYAFEADATRLFIGGAFTTIGGASRTGLAAFNLTTLAIDVGWNANLDGSVRDLFLLGSQLYLVGGFETMGAARRGGAARVSAPAATGGIWDPRTGPLTFCVAATATRTFVGGGFVVVNYENSTPNYHHNLAAYDFSPSSPTFGRPLPIALEATYSLPASPSNVMSLSFVEPYLFVGGDFNRLNGLSRQFAGIFDVRSWSLGSWINEINGRVDAISGGFSGDFIAGGSFTTPSVNVGVFSSAGTLTNSLPTPSPLNSLLDVKYTPDGTLYYAGGFDFPRRRYASLPYPWTSVAGPDPFPTDSITSSDFIQIRTLEVGTQFVYAGGWFRNYGARGRRNLLEIDLLTGMPTSWAPNPDDIVLSLTRSGDRLYAGGFFSHVFGQSRQHLASFDMSHGRRLTSWSPTLGRPFGGTFPYSIAAASNRVAVGGIFEWANGVYNPYLAVFDDQSPPAVAVGENGTVASPGLAVLPTFVQGAATISFTVTRFSSPTLDVVDVQGRLVHRVLSGASIAPGTHRIPFDASGLPAGVYLLLLRDGVNTSSTRFVHAR